MDDVILDFELKAYQDATQIGSARINALKYYGLKHADWKVYQCISDETTYIDLGTLKATVIIQNTDLVNSVMVSWFDADYGLAFSDANMLELKAGEYQIIPNVGQAPDGLGLTDRRVMIVDCPDLEEDPAPLLLVLVMDKT